TRSRRHTRFSRDWSSDVCSSDLQRVTEEHKGTLSTVGHRAVSAKAQGCLTARPTSRAGTKVGLSDPVVLYGRAIAQRIKGTPGITGGAACRDGAERAVADGWVGE